MKVTYSFVFLLRGILYFLAVEFGQSFDPECEEPADITFLLDSSLSICEDISPNMPCTNWDLVKSFIQEVVEGLPIGINGYQVGLVKFSSQVDLYDIIYLDSHSEKNKLKERIGAMGYLGGNTNTSGALWAMRELLFTSTRGDREGVRNVGILITDGLSNIQPNMTLPESRIAKKSDIRLFTIGITKYADKNELQDIASEPASYHFLQAEDFKHLNRLIDQLLGRLCKTRPPASAPCKGFKGDITFLLDSSGSIEDKNPENTTGNYNWELLQNFVIEVVRRLEIGPDKVRLAVIRFSNFAQVIFPLNKHNTSDGIVDQMRKLAFDAGTTNISGALRTMRQEVFIPERGDRSNVQNVGIIVTDGESTVEKNLTAMEAEEVKTLNTRMFSIGLSNRINVTELKLIASKPLSDHFYNTTSIEEVATVVSRLVWRVCLSSCKTIDREKNLMQCQNRTVCPESQLAWRKFANHLLVGHNYARLTHVATAEECQRLCIQDPNCRSIDYVPAIKECAVATETRLNAPDSFASDPSVDYYEWYCDKKGDPTGGVTKRTPKWPTFIITTPRPTSGGSSLRWTITMLCIMLCSQLLTGM